MKNLRSSTKGQDLIEYALMAGIIALAVVVTIPDAMTSVSRIFSTVVGVLNTQVMSTLIEN